MKFSFSLVRQKAYLFSIAFLLSFQAFCSQPDSLVSASAGSEKKAGLYHVNYVVSGIITGVGLVSDIIAIPRIKGKANLSDAELNALNTDIINAIDQWGLRQDASQQTKFAHISDYYMSSVFLLPGLLVLDKNIRKEWGDLLMMYMEGHAVTFTFYNYSPLGPTFNNKFRPATYYTEIPVDERKNGNNRNSFYSGHTASVAFTTFFMAKVYCDYHPDFNAGQKILFYSAAVVPAALEGYLRVKSLAHFPSDNMVGLALGAAIGIIIPELHKNRIKNLSMSMYNVPGGMGLSTSWKIPYQKNEISQYDNLRKLNAPLTN
jgi:hypothetical protein